MAFNSSGGGIANASDVSTSAPATGQVLTYDAGAVKWSNQQASVRSVNGKTGVVALTAANVGAVATTSANMRIDYGTSLPAAGTPGRLFIVVPS